LPGVLAGGLAEVAFGSSGSSGSVADAEAIKGHFPRTFGRPALRLIAGKGPASRGPINVGVVLSGGQAPGGHNVITGLLDALSRFDPGSRTLGFLGGPKGIFTDRFRELTEQVVAPYRNTGGFDMIGGGRDKIETEQQLAACRATCDKHRLDGLVIIGGDDSNTNAAVLAEYFLEHGVATAVVGVPKTIDGDMRGQGIETSFGFDTATKVYSELIGNICRDARSAGKYWHFVKLMGRHASHVTLECALQTRANVALIGEEVRARNLTLGQVVEHVADVVCRRAEAGRPYGVCLVPEGLIEFIPEISSLIGELNRVVHEHAPYLESLSLFTDKQEFVNQKLGRDASYVFSGVPARIQQQLLLDRDSHGNVQVSRIDTEALLVEQIAEQLAQRKIAGDYSATFSVQEHFFGYEGRCAAPSNFDADYTYSLGHVAASLIVFGQTGYICAVGNLAGPAEEWTVAGVPLTSMMQVESRKGVPTPVIGKAFVELDAAPFLTLLGARRRWEIEDAYHYPGALQYYGPPEICSRPSRTLLLESGGSA